MAEDIASLSFTFAFLKCNVGDEKEYDPLIQFMRRAVVDISLVNLSGDVEQHL